MMHKRRRLQIYLSFCIAFPIIAAFVKSLQNAVTNGDALLMALNRIDLSISYAMWWIMAAIIAMRLDASK